MQFDLKDKFKLGACKEASFSCLLFKYISLDRLLIHESVQDNAQRGKANKIFLKEKISQFSM
jgi:hypothetical protein